MPPPNGKRKGGVVQSVARWVARQWRALLAELVSTGLLVGLGCASCLPEGGGGLLRPALAFGGLVAGLGAAFGGPHMNPAVTLAAALLRRVGPAPALAFGAAQAAGGALGYALLAALVPAARRPLAAVTLPAADVSAPAAALLELAMTALLVLAVCALWAAPAPSGPAGPLLLGLLVAGLVLVGGWLTGASVNPARSLAPALYHGHWLHHWVYWVGPLGGALVGVGLHVLLHGVPARGAAPGTAHGTAPGTPHGTAPPDSYEDGEPRGRLALHERSALRDQP